MLIFLTILNYIVAALYGTSAVMYGMDNHPGLAVFYFVVMVVWVVIGTIYATMAWDDRR